MAKSTNDRYPPPKTLTAKFPPPPPPREPWDVIDDYSPPSSSSSSNATETAVERIEREVKRKIADDWNGAPLTEAEAEIIRRRLGSAPGAYGYAPDGDCWPYTRSDADFILNDDDANKRDRAAKPLKATPFDPDKWKIIKPREWLYSGHYIRSYVTGTSAPSKQGKSTVVLAEAVSMMTGFDLLGVGASQMSPRRLKVWVWNGEETEEELVRRLKALCLYYGRASGEEDEPRHPRFDFSFEDLRGYLYLDSGRDTPIKIARLEGHGNVKVAEPVVDGMIATIDGEGIDVTIIDPFINAHSVPENSEHMDAVVGAFKDIAYQTHTSIENVHHTRKGHGDADVTSEDSRGSSAILAAWRDSRVINVMNGAEAKEQGIGNRFRFVRLESDRPNMTVRGEGARWFYLESVSLDNAADGRPADNVGIAVPWSPTVKSEAQAAADEPRILGAVLKLIDSGKRITKERGGDYTVAKLVPYLKREYDIKASADEVRAVLDVACEDRSRSGGDDAALEYMDDPKRGKAGYRRLLPSQE